MPNAAKCLNAAKMFLFNFYRRNITLFISSLIFCHAIFMFVSFGSICFLAQTFEFIVLQVFGAFSAKYKDIEQLSRCYDNSFFYLRVYYLLSLLLLFDFSIIFRSLSIQSFVHFRLAWRYVFTSNTINFWCLFSFFDSIETDTWVLQSRLS